MLLKLLFQFREEKDAITRRFEIANVFHSNVLQKVVEELQTMPTSYQMSAISRLKKSPTILTMLEME